MSNQALIAKNEARWKAVEFHPAALSQAMVVAKRLVAAKENYVTISNKTGVPWYIIAVIHEREASQRWDRSIAQGDPWNRVSIHVPKGRGAFSSWNDAACDALTNCAPYASRWSDWSMGGALTLLELYNGLGYENHGIASPYIWSGTNQYISGKYVADGVFDAGTVDSQLGCAVLIKAIETLCPALYATPSVTPEPTPEETTAIEAPKAGPVGDADDAKPAVQSTTIWASIGTVLASAGSFLTADWKPLCVIAMAALAAYIIYERQGKPDIKGLL